MVTAIGFLKYQKKLVKKEIKRKIIAGLDKQELVLLKFSTKETQTLLRWEHAKEFEFKGEMYDVVETKITSDSIHYWCWWDFEETALNKKLFELTSLALNNNPQKKETQNQLINFYKSLFFENFYGSDFEDKKLNNPMVFNLQLNLDLIFHSPPIPPPEMFL